MGIRASYASIICGLQKGVQFYKKVSNVSNTRAFGVPKKLVRLIRVCLNGSRGRVRVGGNATEPFEIRDGLKQGDGLSTTLFNLTLEYVVRKLQSGDPGVTLNGTTQILGYADDLDLLGDSREAVQINTRILLDAAKETGLEINEEKTKYMVMDRLGTSQEMGDLQVGRHTFEKVSEFRYLGTTVNDKNEIGTEINKRIHSGNACFLLLMGY